MTHGGSAFLLFDLHCTCSISYVRGDSGLVSLAHETSAVSDIEKLRTGKKARPVHFLKPDPSIVKTPFIRVIPKCSKHWRNPGSVKLESLEQCP